MARGVPLIDVSGLTKAYGGPRPLRVDRLHLQAGERVVLSGLDQPDAETLINLMTGASLPDAGTVRVAGQDTRDIATDTEWLASLDRFGIVTRRAVLIESLSIAANLALPITLAIDPMSDQTRVAVRRLAGEVGLSQERLADPAGTLRTDERLRVHLARALALDPAILILEHPTTELESDEPRASFGRTLRAIGSRRPLGWLAISEDERFAGGVGGRRLRLDPDTGRVSGGGFWRRLALTRKGGA